MATKRIVWTDQIPPELLAAARAELPAGFELAVLSPARDTWAAELAGADYLLASGRLAIDAAILDLAPKVRFVQKMGVGYEILDLDELVRRGIAAAVTRNVNHHAVAEHTVGLILAVLRQTARADRMLRAGSWGKWSLRLECFELYGKTVGLVGCGAIGQAVARRLGPFGVQLLYTELRRLPPELERELGLTYVDLPTLLADADIVSLHLPLLPENRHLIDARALARMKPSAVLINTSRGGIVDERALIEALRQRAIHGAGLDVFEQEPLPPDHPLLTLDNVVVVPHLGGATIDTFRRTVRKALENIRRFDAGLDPLPEDMLIPRPRAGDRSGAIAHRHDRESGRER